MWSGKLFVSKKQKRKELESRLGPREFISWSIDRGYGSWYQDIYSIPVLWGDLCHDDEPRFLTRRTANFYPPINA